MNYRRWTMRTCCLAAVLALVCLLVPAARARASIIEGVGTVERVTEGPYLGWYKYTYEVTWNLSHGLSHLDVVHKPGCLADDHVLWFDTDWGGSADGLSTDDDWKPGDPISLTVPYEGTFGPGGDPSTGLTSPLVKWEPTGSEPGKQGVAQFWYYANIIPEYGTFDDVVVAKAGRYVVLGDLTGAYPSCSVIHAPEPATLALLLFGVGVTACRKGRP